MTTSQLRKAWIALHREKQGSKEEHEAYHKYILAKQGIKEKRSKSSITSSLALTAIAKSITAKATGNSERSKDTILTGR